MLTKSDFIEKHSKFKGNIELKSGGSYVLENDEAAVDTFGSQILDYEREKHLHISWKDKKFSAETYDLLVRFMPCRSDTEFCTEIHLIFKHVSRLLSEEEYGYFSDFFEAFLENVRLYQNKEWVIQDADLNMSYLKGSVL